MHVHSHSARHAASDSRRMQVVAALVIVPIALLTVVCLVWLWPPAN